MTNYNLLEFYLHLLETFLLLPYCPLQNFYLFLVRNFALQYLNLIKHHCVRSVQIRSLFWSVFSRIRTEYGEIRSIFPCSVQMLENADKNNSKYGHFLRSVHSITTNYFHYFIACIFVS